MALKGKREGGGRGYHNTTVFTTSAHERGGFLTLTNTAGSGDAFGSSAMVGSYAANPSGKIVLGVLLEDTVTTDQTRYHLNWHKAEVPVNYPVSIMNQGFVVTDMTEGSITTVGPAYLAHSGRVARSDVIGGNQIVGDIETLPDEDGFVRVRFNLPR